MVKPTKDPVRDSDQPGGVVEFVPLTDDQAYIQRRAVEKKAERKAKRDLEAKGGLTITSLMDAMTILLVFLLMTITSDPLNVKQDDNLLLAKSTVDYNPGIDSIPIMITKQHIIVDHQSVVQVECTLDGRICTSIAAEGNSGFKSLPEGDVQALNWCESEPTPADCAPDVVDRLKRMRFRVDKSYKQDGSDEQFLIVPLHKKLQQLVKNQKEENLALGREFKGVTTILADRNIPFRMLAEVVHTAGMAELGDIRFAVIKSSNR